MPNPEDPRLTERVAGTDQTGAAVEIRVPVERPLTLYLNAQEIVTMMTIGDYPEYLALGYLLNQNMLKYDDVVTEVEYDDDLQVVVVRTEHHTNFEAKLKKRTQTSGCAQGTAFGDLLEAVESVALPKAELRTSWLYQMTHAINTMPSLYLEAGAIHGCVLCKEGTPVCYTEDVGRHNAVDKIAGWIYRHGVDPADKILYTTGRLTSEMVIKTVRMGIPILVSRSGFTAWGVELARQVGLTLVGRTRGKRFIALSGQERIVFDQDLDYVEEESARHKRKGESESDEGWARNSRRVARRRAGAADGRRRQADAHDRRPHHPRSRDRAAEAAMRRPHSERQWRSRALCGVWASGHCGRRRRFSGTARRHSGGARLGCGQPARCKARFQRRRRLPVPAARSGVAAPCGARSGECRTRRRSFRRPVPSGDRIMERRACANNSAMRLWSKTSGKSTAGPRDSGLPP